MRVVVCSGRYHLLFIVASACPFVIYVCFMARRIRKHLIKDGRVVGVREATEPGRGGRGGGTGRLRKGHTDCIRPREIPSCSVLPCCNCGHGFTCSFAASRTAVFRLPFLFSVWPTFCYPAHLCKRGR